MFIENNCQKPRKIKDSKKSQEVNVLKYKGSSLLLKT